MAIKQVINTLMEETPKEEKEKRIIALLKSNNETMERIADKRAYEYHNTKQILNKIVKRITTNGEQRKIQTIMKAYTQIMKRKTA